jgi:hypothetical protein
MRTTLTLDDDVVTALKRKRRENEDISFKDAVNTAIRDGLLFESETRKRPKKKFELKGRLLHSKVPFNFDKPSRLAEFADNDPDFRF